MAEQLPLSSKKRKRNQEEEEEVASSGGSSTHMDFRTSNEQRLYIDVLKTTALPRGGNNINWLSIDLWNAVTDEYNRRAPERRVPERTMPSLIQLGKKLQFCNCMPGQTCCCTIPEFPNIDGPGEPSSHMSLGTGSVVHNSHLAASEASQILENVSSELLRLRRAGKFSWNLLEEYSVAWQKELDTGTVFGKMFMSGSDQEKVKLTKRVFQRQRI